MHQLLQLHLFIYFCQSFFYFYYITMSHLLLQMMPWCAPPTQSTKPQMFDASAQGSTGAGSKSLQPWCSDSIFLEI